MRPTTSCPGTRGQLIGKRASTVPESEWQTPHASTRMRTWPGPGSTSGFITASNSPGFVTWIALYIALISPPSWRAIRFLRKPAPPPGNRRSQSTHGCSSQKMQYAVQIDGIWSDLFQGLEKTRDAMSSSSVRVDGEMSTEFACGG